MSRIFEALKRSSGADSAAARNVLPADQQELLEAAGVAGSTSDESRALHAAGLDEFDVGPKSELPYVKLDLDGKSPLLPFDVGRSQAAEQYRIVRTKILQHKMQPRRLIVSSPESGDGKSINAVNLAGVLALNPEANVLLVDGDLHRCSLAKFFKVPSTPGLGEVLSGDVKVSEAVVRIEGHSNLFFLPGGKGARASAELLDSRRAKRLSDALGKQFTYMVIDSPPAGAVADFDLLMQNGDGVVLILRQDHTNRMLCMKTIEAIPKEKLVGVILNYVKPWFLGKTFGYYQYYHYSKYYRR